MNRNIDGKETSLILKDEIKKYISDLNIKPKLVVIQVGNNESSNTYIRNKEKTAQYVGIEFSHIKYEEGVEEVTIIDSIKKMNKDNSINGIIVQLPLPSNLDSTKIINSIDSSKDVDGLTSINLGKLVSGEDCFVSCTPSGIIYLLKKYNVSLSGKNVVIVGRSTLVGKPLMHLFLRENATVTICHSKTNNLKEYTSKADILVVAIGQKEYITSEMVKDGAIVVDVGINSVDNHLYGDVNYKDVLDKVKLITPVPGGVGPMTVSMLMNNVLTSYKIKNNLK